MMKKITLLLTAMVFAFTNLMAQTPPTTSWNDFAETQWYNTTAVSFNITTAEDFAGLAERWCMAVVSSYCEASC